MKTKQQIKSKIIQCETVMREQELSSNAYEVAKSIKATLEWVIE